MEFYTSEGIKYYVLPDCARCKITGKHPSEMEKCPEREFDDFGLICCPDLCEEYTEQED